MAEGEPIRPTPRMRSWGTGFHVQQNADRKGYLQEVVLGEDSRGRPVPIAIAIVPEAWAEAIGGFVLQVPEDVEAPEEGLSAADRVDFPDALAGVHDTEDQVRLSGLARAGGIVPPRPRGEGVPPPTPHELASVAEVYLFAQRRNPRQPLKVMQEAFEWLGFGQIDRETLRHHVRMARIHRYLTQSTVGKAGAAADSALVEWRERRPWETEKKPAKKSRPKKKEV